MTLRKNKLLYTYTYSAERWRIGIYFSSEGRIQSVEKEENSPIKLVVPTTKK